jgi:hypothetical protein
MMQKRLTVAGKYELAASLLESPENRCKHSESVVNAKRVVYVKLMEKNQNQSFKYVLYSANRATELWSLHFKAQP